jgi:membrane protease YdiL (CAAX protease family)
VALSLLDAYVFAPYMEGYDVLDAAAANMTLDGWLAALLYGGIIEEVMLRLFFLSLIAFLLRKIFCKGMDTASLPVWLFSVANILAALLFAAGHLPATAMTFGTLTPVLLIRCFLLNGGLGLGFGWLYRKYGIGYAMLAHGGCHICMRLLFLLIL